MSDCKTAVVTVTQRLATENDITLVYYMLKESLYEHVETIWGWDEQFQVSRHELKYKPDNIQILECDGRPVGFVEVEVQDLQLTLKNIGLVHQFRGRGLGSAVIRHLQKESCHLSRPIILEVFKVNTRAIEFYERHAFEQTGTKEFYVKMIWRPEWNCK